MMYQWWGLKVNGQFLETIKWTSNERPALSEFLPPGAEGIKAYNELIAGMTYVIVKVKDPEEIEQ